MPGKIGTYQRYIYIFGRFFGYRIAEILKQNSSWQHVINYPITQQMGSDWLRKQGTAVLKVPSAIIDLEHNYLFNPSHPDFAKMKITNVRKFNFDDRLKAK
jgi:RES domain-containing protein